MILLALLGSAGLLALLVTTTLLLTAQSKDAADVLPADGTMLVLFSPSATDVARAATWFPVLKQAQIPQSAEAVAILRLPSNELATLTLVRGADAGGERLSSFHVITTQPEAVAMLRTTEATLSQLRPFRSLSRAWQNEMPWTFLDTHALPATDGDADALLRTLLFAESRFVALGTHGTQVVYDRFADANDSAATVTSGISASGSLLQITGYAPFTQFSAAVREHAPAIHTTLRSALFTEFHRIAGEGVSWEFDVAPLLAQRTTILVHRNGSGALLFAARGNGQSEEHVTKAIERLRMSAALQDAQVEVRTRTFDDRFEARDIRLREQESGFQETEHNGWRRITGHSADGTTPLLMAQNGSAFVLANDDALFDAALNGQTRAITTGTLSLGHMDVGALQTWLQQLLPSAPALTSPLLPTMSTGSLLEWHRVRENDRIRTILKASEA
jgi:hypothetical protein